MNEVFVYGKTYKTPRMSAFLGSNNVTYRYSGLQHVGSGWPVWLIPLLNKVNKVSGEDFNGCLLNLYRDGLDSMGWHSDNEPELDQKASIASVSLGIGRDLLLRSNDTKTSERLFLGNGDLVIFHPDCQKYWKHSLPKRRRVKEERINLTFRRYL